MVKFLEWVSMFLLALSVCITFINVVFRYILKTPLFWADEIATLALIAMVFLPAAGIEKTVGHLRVTILFQLLGYKMERLGEVIKILATVSTGIYLVWAGVPVIYENYQLYITTVALRIPTAFTLAVIPIAFLFITLANIFLSFDLIKKRGRS